MKKLLLPLAFLVFVLGVVVHYNMTKKLSSQEKASSITTTKQVQITNPDYLANPSAYLVDYENKVSSRIPYESYSYRMSSEGMKYMTIPKYNKTLWVEDIINYHTLLVSYPIERAGAKVIELEYLPIPGLGYPSGTTPRFMWGKTPEGECWVNGMSAFLATNLLHKPVYLMKDPEDSLYSLIILIDGQSDMEYHDAAAFLVSIGYGGTRIDKPDNNDLFSEREPFYKYSGFLKEEEEIASLAERGLWSTCSDE